MEPKKKTLLRIACLILALISGFNFLSGIAAWLIANVFGGISFPVRKAATIGIIGGADGPTAVFVTAAHPNFWEILLWLALLVAALYGHRHFLRKG